ncbi:MAG: 5-formyltetrahydrofolate cyclo-ligase [Halanaerobiaceae bacterium]
MNEKNIIRKKYFNIRKRMKFEQIVNCSKEITEMFLNLDMVINSSKLLLYYSIRNEIITHELIKNLLMMEKEVYLPYISNDKKNIKIAQITNLLSDMQDGAFGIKEPVNKDNSDINKMDIIVVPGLIFDRNGYRIGYGGGYYDRLLGSLNNDITTIGLAYEDFLQDSLPVENFDIPVDIIITEKDTYYPGGEYY